jgi:ribosome modulation factor
MKNVHQYEKSADVMLFDAMKIASAAREEGAEAARAGKKRDDCPHQDELSRVSWEDGYSREVSRLRTKKVEV